MKIERSFDYDLIERIMAHPAIYPDITDDGSPEPEDFNAASGENIYYLIVRRDDNEAVGLFFVHPHNAILYEIHTCLLPTCRGECADKAAQLVLDWIFEHITCEKLITHVPAFNKPAYSYAKRAGLVKEGVNRSSFLKDGQLYDLLLMGITRGELCRQPLQQ
ncbi:MAG: GNAT family N-acetyltransferase [Kiritimatiellaceae bacterium]|nr:GNAT family N-acetyltransferase [Kiritimatiellaceae bacterium]